MAAENFVQPAIPCFDGHYIMIIRACWWKNFWDQRGI